MTAAGGVQFFRSTETNKQSDERNKRFDHPVAFNRRWSSSRAMHLCVHMKSDRLIKFSNRCYHIFVMCKLSWSISLASIEYLIVLDILAVTEIEQGITIAHY